MKQSPDGYPFLNAKQQQFRISKFNVNRYTEELQRLEHLWNYGNMCETGVVRANECYSLRHFGEA